MKRQLINLQRIVTITVLVLLLGFSRTHAVFVQAEENRSPQMIPPQILLISPFDISFVQDFEMTAALLDHLNQSGTSYRLERFNLELRNEKISTEKLAERQQILENIRAGEYRIIVCFGMPSLNLLKESMDILPKDVSVIVCGITTLDQEQVPPNFYAVLQKVDVNDDFKLIRQLFPTKKNVILLTCWHETGVRILTIARSAIKDFPELTLHEVNNKTVSTDQMFKEVEEAGNDSVILFQGWYNKDAVNAASLQRLMFELGNRTEVPLFVMHSVMMRFGTIGGCIEDGKETGRTTARLVLDILSGKKSPRFQELSSRIVLNEPMLQFYNIEDDLIPEDAIIQGRNERFVLLYQHIQDWLVIIGVVLVILTGLGFCYAVGYYSLNRRLKAVFSNLPLNFAVIDKQEKVLLYYGNNEANGVDRGVIRVMKDFSEDVYPFFKKIINLTFQTGESQHREYVRNGYHRRGDCVQLESSVFGRPTVLWASVDIDNLVTVSENEKLLNRCLETMMQASQSDEAIAPILKMICEYFKGDRSYILKYNYEKNLTEFVEEYSLEGLEKVSVHTPSVKFSTSDSWYRRLHDRQVFEYNMELIPDHDIHKGAWAETLQWAGVKMLYSVPIFFDGKLWGNFGLAFEREAVVLEEGSQTLISSIGHMLEMALLRQSYISELASALEEAKVSMRMKSAFLSTISHELRTPLNAVIGFSELLSADDVTPAEEKEYVTGINMSGKSLLRLINDILDFSKLEANQMVIASAPTDLNNTFQELEAIFKQTAVAKDIGLNFNLSKELSLLLLDELRVRQILMNLIGNALKYTSQGAVSVDAEYDTDRNLRLIVSDTGIGIDPKAQTMIFEPFLQQDAIRDTKIFKGTGLGLAIVKTLAERMGGSVQLQSEIGKGSTFTVLLPAVDNVEKPAVTISSDDVVSRQLSISPSVLLVDDTPLNLKVLEAMLRQLNITRIKTTDSSREALEILKTHHIDIVFSDLWMPEINGSELVKIIRNDLKLTELKIITVTADAEFNDEDNLFDATLFKPYTKDVLQEILYTVGTQKYQIEKGE